MKGALLVSALFVCAGAVQAAGRCPADRLDERVAVRHVLDGDTVVLADGRKVRLIGINAPELARRQAPAEAFAAPAQGYLRRLLADGGYRASLRYGVERRDPYGRVLAHLFTADGRNAQALMLQQGLAAPIAFPPNLWQHACYRRAAGEARAARRGIWSLERYQGLAPRAVRAAGEGFYAVEGRILGVTRTRRSVWLEMGYDFALRIAREDLLQFRTATPESLRGRTVRALGWVSQRHRPRMRLRHPSQLELLR